MAKMYCTTCGNVGQSKKDVKGSLMVELFFWIIGLASLLFFPPLILLPIIYSAWRIFSKKDIICKSCKSATLIPVDSPVAKQAIDAKIEAKFKPYGTSN